jgi:hypothetical protein
MEFMNQLQQLFDAPASSIAPLREDYATSSRERKKIEMLLAHLRRMVRLDRQRFCGPSGRAASCVS